jgi:hypothetical protein
MTNAPSATLASRDELEICLRAYVPPPAKQTDKQANERESQEPKQGPSEYTLIFDTETTIDERQSLRCGAWQFRKSDELVESGLFYDPKKLKSAEQKTLKAYAKLHALPLLTVRKFVDTVFYGMAYDLRAAIVGFNLPFDISRLAIRHARARGRKMGGGFTFQLSSKKPKPRVQIKHLNARASLIQFTKPPRPSRTRSMARNKLKTKPWRGAFVDIKTIAAALTS